MVHERILTFASLAESCSSILSPSTHWTTDRCKVFFFMNLFFSASKQAASITAIFDVRQTVVPPRRVKKLIPEVYHIWRQKASTPNNLEKSHLVCVLHLFRLFLDQNEKKRSITSLREGWENPNRMSNNCNTHYSASLIVDCKSLTGG